MTAHVHKPTAAVLLIVFNRPDTTRKVVEALEKYRPSRLYIAADGPRPEKAGEGERCAQARQAATNVSWACEVKTRFQEQNLGCKKGVSSAIDWFLEQEEEGIILEDDCVASPTFFPFAQEMLERYRENDKVMTISAQHFQGSDHQPLESYFFSNFAHCWGWATWRRAWSHYDRSMSSWPVLRDSGWLQTVCDGGPSVVKHWNALFESAYMGKVDTWDYAWQFSCWKRGALSVLPRKNLVTNIGFRGDATHTLDPDSPLGRLPLEDMDFPLIHPFAVSRDRGADAWMNHKFYRFVSPGSLRWALRAVKARLKRIGF